MGKRGPKPKKKVTTVSPGRPVRPDDLDDGAIVAWEKVCEDLESQKILSTTDAALIALYARTHSLWQRTVKQLETEALVFEAGNGRPYINPLANLASNLSGRLKTLLSELGLTPRGRTPAEPDKEKNPLKDLCES